MLFDAGSNAVAFDGPGQGEMWKSMKMIPEYHEAVSAIIDWLEVHYASRVALDRVGAIGFSMGGYFAPVAAAYDKRIGCVAANGGPADLRFLLPERNANPILFRGLPRHEERNHSQRRSKSSAATSRTRRRWTARCDPSLRKGPDHSGRKHAEKYMQWAVGNKELKFYPDGEALFCANYLDEVLPYAIDWLKKRLI